MNRGVGQFKRAAWTMLAGAVAALAAASPAAATPFTWTGQAASVFWSTPGNWSPAGSPLGASSLTFGALAAPCVTGTGPGIACYVSNNDVSGINVNSISIDSGKAYDISGLPVTVGAGGLAAAPSAPGGGPSLLTPLVLSASQTWSVNGYLDVGQIAAAGHALTVRFEANSFPQNGLTTLALSGDAETGSTALTGEGVLEIVSGGRLNANGAPVALSDRATLWPLTPATVGALATAPGTTLLLTGNAQGSPEPLNVLGSATLGAGTSVQIGLFGAGVASELTGSRVHLAANLELFLEGMPGGACPALTPGQSYALVSSSQPITGQFVPSGTTMQIFRECNGAKLAQIAMITDTAHAVTATIMATPAIPPILAWLKRLLKPTGKLSSITKIVAHGGFKFVSSPPAPGTVDIEWMATAKHKQVTVASARQVVGVRKTKLRVTLTRAGRRLLKHSTKLRVTARAAFTYPNAGAHQTFTLKG